MIVFLATFSRLAHACLSLSTIHEQVDAPVICQVVDTNAPAKSISHTVVGRNEMSWTTGIFESGFYGKVVRLPLHDMTLVDAVLIDGFEYPLGGWYGWGILDDNQGGGYFTVAVKGNAIRATLCTGNQLFRIRRLASENQDTDSTYKFIIESSEHDNIIDMMPGYSHVRHAALTRGIANIIVDHVIAYSSNFEANIGDYDNDSVPGTRDDAIAIYMNAISWLNIIYLVSDIQISARLAYAYPTNIYSLDIVAFDELIDRNDGILDEIFLVRDIVQADLGSYSRYVGPTGGSGTEAQGYNTNPNQWLSLYGTSLEGNISAHEIGHNMGMAHSRQSATLPHSSIPYAYSYCLPIAQRITLMGGGLCGQSPVLLQYSNPNLIYRLTSEPMGIDHNIDPSNSADGARAHNTTAPLIANFRAGTAIYPDCDGDQLLDAIEIGLDYETDYDDNTVPDACQIATDPSLDCNFDGILDSTQLEWDISWSDTLVEVIPPATREPVVVELRWDPDSDLIIDVILKANYNAAPVQDRRLEVFVNGVSVGFMFDGTWVNCSGSNADTLVVDWLSIPSPVVPGTLVVELVGPDILSGFCAPNQFLTANIDFQSVSPIDQDRDGLIDCMDPSCNIADNSTPYDQLDFVDVSTHLAWFNALDPRADLAPPLGVWNSVDISIFLDAYNAGCP